MLLKSMLGYLGIYCMSMFHVLGVVIKYLENKRAGLFIYLFIFGMRSKVIKRFIG